jgi:hypothetical protein
MARVTVTRTAPNVVSEAVSDLAFMETLRAMKAHFQSAVIRAAQTDDQAALLSLRQESLYQLAEFLFALRAYGVDSAGKIENLASLHNDHQLGIRDDPERMRRCGLSLDRIENALFTGDVLRKLTANFAASPWGIDQSDLARFLVTVMSSETCRKLVLACEKAGFLGRARSPYGAVLVQSTGKLENVYGTTLREARHAATR